MSVKRILIGVTGSIAAYKAAELVRLFVKRGDSVRVVMTPAATRFVAPLTFETLSKNPVGVEMFESSREWSIQHIAYAEADAAIVAPASANTIAKMRFGLADNLLTATLLATRAKIFVAPAMNVGMWENAATRENLDVLRARGVEVIGPRTGELACGVSAAGRMEEPQVIFEEVAAKL